MMTNEIDSDWPNSEYSRFLFVDAIRWHIQEMGNGPCILMIHGTGASTHSWARLASLLAKNFKVICIDLPGHGYTQIPGYTRLSLSNMAKQVAALLASLESEPSMVVGHSAGAAIMVQMNIEKLCSAPILVSINGALLPLGGMAGHLFSPAAKLLSKLPLVSWLFSQHAQNPEVAERMLAQTGSRLGSEDIDWYRRLLRKQTHVDAALKMMANWNLQHLKQLLPNIQNELYLIACENDKTIPYSQSKRVSQWVKHSKFKLVPRLGHLGHEEDPELFFELITTIAVDHDLIKT